jgi:cytochrome c553
MFRSVIATVVFILAFVLIALSVFFVAMSGGTKGARSSLQTQSRGGRRTVSAGIAIICLGTIVAIPLAIMIFNHDTQAKEAPGGVKLTNTEHEGRQIFAQYCSTCHTLAASNAVGRVGPNLDVLQPKAPLVENAIKLGRAQGNGSMPQQLVVGEQAKAVAAYVQAVAGH